MVDHMQVGVFNDGWWITCRSEFSTTDGDSCRYSTTDGGSHAGLFNDGWMGSHAGRSFQRRMVDHMHGVFNDGWWITAGRSSTTCGSHQFTQERAIGAMKPEKHVQEKDKLEQCF
ncbi:Hypothetical predicted protein [Mytilus galloprovincialis]|uniref:Uncharacterized protein n=1 Tax=Mytilus galloprovincialis TaxID=29158 RepID=A0A8B6HKG2_MYTGA|nr:Hypothetical predicted protein [Mytilus galloprovincialis]